MRFDVVAAVRSGNAHFSWAEVESRVGSDTLYISVMRDAVMFNSVPELNWYRTILKEDKTSDNVRVPVNASEMQAIADMLFCMLPTPYILDLVWKQSRLRFDPVVNLGPGKIVATQNINDVSAAIAKKISENGSYPAHGIISSVGKYWTVCNALVPKHPDHRKYGIKTACNYGWHSHNAPSSGVIPGVRVWQGIGTRHNDEHVDPSQVIRLVYRMARLVRSDGSQERVDLHSIASDEVLSAGINHVENGISVLNVLRQPSVPDPTNIFKDGVTVMPELVFYANQPPADMSPSDLKNFKFKSKK